MCKDVYMQVLLWLLHLLSVTCCPCRVVPMMMQHVQWAWHYWQSCHLNSAVLEWWYQISPSVSTWVLDNDGWQENVKQYSFSGHYGFIHKWLSAITTTTVAAVVILWWYSSSRQYKIPVYFRRNIFKVWDRHTYTHSHFMDPSSLQ